MAFACPTKVTLAEVSQHLKIIFAHHGIPQELIFDNGPQFTSWEFFSKSTKANDFVHTTSSPRYPQKAMRAVRTMNALLKKASDPLLLALLAYRSTPLQNGYSLAERLMCRKPCTTVSVVAEQARQRCPTVPYLLAKEMQQKPTYDRCHNARSLDRSLSGDRLNAIEQDPRNRPAAMLFLVTSKRCPHHTMVT